MFVEGVVSRGVRAGARRGRHGCEPGRPDRGAGKKA